MAEWKLPVLVINLAEKPEQYVRVVAMAAEFGIPSTCVERLDAVRGSALPEHERAQYVSLRGRGEIEAGQRESHQGLPSWGAVGCTLSHMKAWRECVRRNETILVLEDDVVFHGGSQEWKDTVLDIAQSSGTLWDVCVMRGRHLEGSEASGVRVLSNPWPRGASFYGTEAYLLSPAGAALLLTQALPINQQTDFYIQSMAAYHGLKLADSMADLAGQMKMKGSSIQQMCIKCHMPNLRASSLFFIVPALLLCVVWIVRLKGCCQKIASCVKR